MEAKPNIKDHVVYVCDNCGAICFVMRCDFDPKDSVFFATSYCPRCRKPEHPFKLGEFFGKNGFLGDDSMIDWED